MIASGTQPVSLIEAASILFAAKTFPLVTYEGVFSSMRSIMETIILKLSHIIEVENCSVCSSCM